ncbi:MAG: OmpA family protein [Flavobacteriales bacterium]|nr:OmpA family protein [Flavobacteriales bacterium]
MIRYLLKYTLLLLTFMLLAPRPQAMAQLDATLYEMSTIPQVRYTNPAKGSDYKWYIGLPGISSIYANYHHNGFVVDDLFSRRADDSVFLDLNDVIQQLGDRNLFGFNLQVDLLAMGWTKGKHQFFFNITEKALLRLRYPKDLIRLLWEGNGAFLDQTIDLSGSAFRFSEYREYAFGMSRAFTDDLTIGAKAKLLGGYINASTTVNELELFTAPNTFELSGTSDIEINTSAPAEGSTFPDGFFALTNVGFGIDLGATYKVNEKLSVSGSIIDLGFIKWKRNPSNFSNDLDGVTFTGNALNTFTDTSIQQPFGEIVDSLSITFDNRIETNTAYKDGLIPRIYLGGTYNLTETSTAGLLFHGEYFKKAFYPSFTLSYNYKLPKWIGASASYSIMNGSFFNLGLGLSVNLGPFQIYVVSDNIAALFNLSSVNNESAADSVTGYNVIIASKAKTMHIRTGIGLTFGKAEKDKDKDGIIDKEDECPDTPGSKEYNGCPDKDGDTVIDKYDECPDDPGLPENKGCPDRDEDNVVDKDDECPDVPGKPENKGCPVKLILLDPLGNELTAAELNEDGFFVFENLPNKDKYLFKLDADDMDLIEEVQILQTLDGKETILTAFKNEDGLFLFESEEKQRQRLYLIDPKGDTLMMAELDDNGFFVFSNLPSNENHIFLLDGGDDLLEDLLIMLIDSDGNETIIRAKQDASNDFKYSYIPPKGQDLDLLEEEEIPVILLEEEQEIIKEAFDNLEFNSGSDVISFGSYTALQSLSELMLKKPEWRIKLSGHTDNVGPANINLLLSKQRAQAVKRILEIKGVDPDRIIVRYFGEDVPIANNETKAGQQTNRRVEMLILHPEDYVDKSAKADEVSFKDEVGIWFKVQIAASSKPIQTIKENFKGEENVSEYVNRGMYKYTTGKAASLGEANKLLATMKAKGFTQAFIVAFKDGKRIPVAEAIKLKGE